MKGMNFKSIDIGELDGFVRNDQYAFEQKMDGTRALIEISPDDVKVLSRAGTPLKHSAAVQHLPGIVASIPSTSGGTVVLDGEIMFDTGLFHAFDLPFLDQGAVEVKPSLSFRYRRLALETFLQGRMGPFLRLVPSFTDSAGKAFLVHEIKRSGGEGVVVKHRDAPYEAGERARHSFKAKIVRTADVVVLKVDRPDPKHGSITYGVYDEDGLMRPLGGCSAIGKPEVAVGDVIEVAYLAWSPGGGLREPRMMRVREDKAPTECREDQLVEYSKAVVR